MLVGKLVTCYIVPFFTIGTTEATISGGTVNLANSDLERVPLSSSQTNKVLRVKPNTPTYTAMIGMHEAMDSHSIYQDFPQYEESKLLMYPYSFTELTTERGDAMVLRNEYFQDRSGSIKVGIFGSLSSLPHIAYAVKDYLTAGYVMENALTDKSNMSLPIIDDYTASYLQSNSNSIAVSRSNALMMQQTTLQNKEDSLQPYQIPFPDLWANLHPRYHHYSSADFPVLCCAKTYSFLPNYKSKSSVLVQNT